AEPEEEGAEHSEIDDAIAELAAMVRGYDNPQPVAERAATVADAVHAEPAARFAPVEDAPEIETIDVPEEAVALADDLDIPDVEYAEDAVPAFDDLDAELAAAFGEPAIEVPQPAAAEPRPVEDDFDLGAGYNLSEGAAFGAAPYAIGAGA